MQSAIRKHRSLSVLLLLAYLLIGPAQAIASEEPLILKTMGSILFGGSVITQEDGDTFHGDHGYAQFFVPQNSRTLPMVMWHGIGQHGKTFESTPDGRDGYMQIMPRRDWSVYIIDQPRRGRAGRTAAKMEENDVPTTMRESSAWNAFRLGVWVPPAARPFFPNVQFPKDEFSVDQFWRQQTPDTGEEPKTAEHRHFMAEAVGDLFKKIGPGILITHSNSGQYGWATAMEHPDLVKAIIAYEPGACAFPENELPAAIPAGHHLVDIFQAPQPVPVEAFKNLTKMPILIVYGDNIAETQSEVFNSEVWRVA
ncbi:MAG: alpha/beta fold hydrolase, partial [Planctomycetaceae bacterium]|nr:alpha/beta fold hydrolase [Planctomycetaceae bacterium]